MNIFICKLILALIICIFVIYIFTTRLVWVIVLCWLLFTFWLIVVLSCLLLTLVVSANVLCFVFKLLYVVCLWFKCSMFVLLVSAFVRLWRCGFCCFNLISVYCLRCLLDFGFACCLFICLNNWLMVI